jgi:hypothetical protein
MPSNRELHGKRTGIDELNAGLIFIFKNLYKPNLISRFAEQLFKLLINLKYVTMKKLYSALAGLVLCGAMFGQTSNGIQDIGTKNPGLSPYVRSAQQHLVIDGTRSKQINYWLDPIVDMMFNKGVNLDDASKPYDEIIYLAPLFMDSTVTVSDPSATTTVSYNEIGNVLDMQSLYLESNPDGTASGGNSQPIFTKTDAFNVDSVAIWGSYVRVNKTQDDTLDIYVVWGDSTDANVFTKRKSSDLWIAPLNSWRTNMFAPTVTGAAAADGNVIKAKAPSPSNSIHVKRVLTAADTSKGSGYSKEIRVFIGANIPAGKIVSCFYTFVPNSAGHTKGQCFYKFGASLVPQQENGYASCVWEQKTPAITTVADYKDYQIDLTKNSVATGTRMTKNARYNKNVLGNSLIGIPVSTPYLQYKITGTSTIGITEYNNNFSLSQNAPNPFTNETSIAYQLKTAAKNVSLVIYNVAGVKLFDKTQTNLSAGKYTVEVNNSNFASGVYFYSLIVDGNQITKKMVVTE